MQHRKLQATTDSLIILFIANSTYRSEVRPSCEKLLECEEEKLLEVVVLCVEVVNSVTALNDQPVIVTLRVHFLKGINIGIDLLLRCILGNIRSTYNILQYACLMNFI